MTDEQLETMMVENPKRWLSQLRTSRSCRPVRGVDAGDVVAGAAVDRSRAPRRRGSRRRPSRRAGGRGRARPTGRRRRRRAVGVALAARQSSAAALDPVRAARPEIRRSRCRELAPQSSADPVRRASSRRRRHRRRYAGAGPRRFEQAPVAGVVAVEHRGVGDRPRRGRRRRCAVVPRRRVHVGRRRGRRSGRRETITR